MVKFIGTVNVGGKKTSISNIELAKEEFKKMFDVEYDLEKYSIVFVPTKMLGSVTYALFQIRE